MITEPEVVQDERELERIATDELGGVAKNWLERKVKYEIVVRAGEPVATILDSEERLEMDMVVMATHGRTASKRYADWKCYRAGRASIYAASGYVEAAMISNFGTGISMGAS